MKQLLLDIQPAASPSLQNFVVGGNAETIHALQQLASGNPAYRFIYLWGASGSGKSHLLQATVALARQHGNALATCDNVHTLDDAAQIALFNTFNELRADTTGKTGGLAVAGEAAPTQMGLRDDLATRLSWGLVYQLHVLSDEEKAQALRTHARERGMKLPDEVVDYCLRYLRRDLPTLMATLDALDQWSLTAKRPVTVPLLKQLLQLQLDI